MIDGRAGFPTVADDAQPAHGTCIITVETV
jgi:hypothetical protein